MEISLCRTGVEDAVMIHQMQVKAFKPLLEKYQDYETNPANESLERVIARMNQPRADYYLIKSADMVVGAIRVIEMNNMTYRISPVFILPEYQGQGIAQKVFAMIEQIYSNAKLWELATVLQERGNCHLYEKLGYRRGDGSMVINDKMTLIFYQKHSAN